MDTHRILRRLSAGAEPILEEMIHEAEEISSHRSAPPIDAEPAEAFSHGGLAAADPWAPPYVPTPRRDHTKWFLGGLAETLDVVILALAMFLCVRFVAHNYVVEGGSMLPTFEQNDLVIVNRLAYREFDLSWIPGIDNDAWHPFGTPSPGDVVVFEYAGDPSHRDFIKRVIAVPGQTVMVENGVVYVDGVRLDEPYIREAPNYSVPPTFVSEGKIFVLGDNRNNSLDSHVFGLVDSSTLIGRADVRYWPAGRWGLIEHVVGEGVSFAGRLVNALGTGAAWAWR